MKFFNHGTLLNFSHNLHTNKSLSIKQKLTAVTFYTYSITKMIKNLHQSGIIHADIKPDNFLLNKLEGYVPSLRSTKLSPVTLIDFGRSIDIKCLTNATKFTKKVNTEDFICTEMQEGEAYCYEMDLYALAGTIHVLLFNHFLDKKNFIHCLNLFWCLENEFELTT